MKQQALASVLLAAVSLVACESPPSGNKSPTYGTIEKYGSKLSLCGLVGAGVCEATVFSVGTAVQPFLQSVTQLPLGIQPVTIVCKFAQGGAPMGAGSSYHNFYLKVTPGASYKIVASYTKTGICAVDIVDASTGRGATVSASGD